MDKIEKELCPICRTKNLTLIEDSKKIDKFNVFTFSMKCSNCNFNQEDVEIEQKQDKKINFNLGKTSDLKKKIIKSSTGIIKIPQLRLTSSDNNGYIDTIEGMLNRFKKELEEERDSAEEDEDRKKAKNLLKKLWKVECGDIKIKIIIEDKEGNSVII